MSLRFKQYSYTLPRKSVKGDCPDCSPNHRKTLSRYVDTNTGQTLPEIYGRCDRESNCGYHLNPYHIQASGASYADEVRFKTNVQPIPKAWFRIAGKQKRSGIDQRCIMSLLTQKYGATYEQAERVVKFIFAEPTRFLSPVPTLVHCIPDALFDASQAHYEHNQLFALLCGRFGMSQASELTKRFNIGTSSHWPGACVFWYIDEQNRKRGGQIKLFNNDWHTVKYICLDGKKRTKTSWVHSALIRRHQAKKMAIPDWLSAYNIGAERSPCLFGLPQLLSAPTNKPIAIVEAPKTAIVCTAYLPDFVWLAVGSLSYLTTATETGLQRLAPIKKRQVMLFPDLSKDGIAFTRWSRVADDLRLKGFQISVSDYLEKNASEDHKMTGFDLADFLLMPC